MGSRLMFFFWCVFTQYSVSGFSLHFDFLDDSASYPISEPCGTIWPWAGQAGHELALLDFDGSRADVLILVCVHTKETTVIVTVVPPTLQAHPAAPSG
jgi:hypothetical protein